MNYRYSQVDRENLDWFPNDNTCATLQAISLDQGHLRGVFPFEIGFKYPISAIAGENGSGKSTLLAMAACAYHNHPDKYCPPGRKQGYYTFSDFFVQAQGELPPSGITISCWFLHDHWRRLVPGLGRQKRRKREGGKWNNYQGRVKRSVVYHGINRVVPHYERSAARSYRKQFTPRIMDIGTIGRIAEIAGRVFGRSYTSFSPHSHNKYRLPVVDCPGIRYSGFNMGAGESAVFDILTSLFEAGRGSLLVIDEIELGLHERAQKRLIDELKELCLEMHCQVICSTHSPAILRALPPEARYYIESADGHTKILPEISADFASGKLRGQNSGEMDLFVEDEVGKAIVVEALPLSVRERCAVFCIGSAEAILHQLAARYREKRPNCMAYLDGDQRRNHKSSVGKVKRCLEGRFVCTDEEMSEWVTCRLRYLPGDTWPEKWLIKQSVAATDYSRLEQDWGGDGTVIRSCLGDASRARKHSEFYSLEQRLHRDQDSLRSDLIRFVKTECAQEFQQMQEEINGMLG